MGRVAWIFGTWAPFAAGAQFIDWLFMPAWVCVLAAPIVFPPLMRWLDRWK